MTRPPCTVCGREGLQHHELLDGFKDIWFCNYSCELTWRQQVTPAAREAARCRKRGVYSGVRCSQVSGHVGACTPTKDDITGRAVPETTHEWLYPVEQNRKSRELEALQRATDQQMTDAVVGAAVLTPEEVDRITGGEVKEKRKCVVCEETVRHANSSALYCSHRCAEKAAGALKAIRLLQPVADRALRFLAGLNLQDHSVKEQRECVDIVHALIKTLRPKRGGL